MPDAIASSIYHLFRRFTLAQNLLRSFYLAEQLARLNPLTQNLEEDSLLLRRELAFGPIPTLEYGALGGAVLIKNLLLLRLNHTPVGLRLRDQIDNLHPFSRVTLLRLGDPPDRIEISLREHSLLLIGEIKSFVN